MVEASKQRVAAAIDVGVKRIGHGIISHVDEGLMERIKSAGICLEVCPTSNRLLDNVPGGIASHPLRALYDAGVPCALGADDPDRCGSPNGQGLVREFLAVHDSLGFSLAELAELAKYSFVHILAPPDVKAAGLKDIDEWLAKCP